MNKLTAVIVAHADVVPDHVRHRSGHQVRLVRVDVDAETHRFGGAHRVGSGHAGSAGETFAPVGVETKDITSTSPKQRPRAHPFCFLIAQQWIAKLYSSSFPRV